MQQGVSPIAGVPWAVVRTVHPGLQQPIWDKYKKKTHKEQQNRGKKQNKVEGRNENERRNKTKSNGYVRGLVCTMCNSTSPWN